MRVTDDIRYIGVNDHEVDLFEGQYIVPNGMAYNSYVILDEKTAVMDSVDARFGEEWLANLAGELGSRKPDYLIVQHMEPDHSANIMRFLEAWPEATVVSSAKAFQMMKNFYGSDLSDRKRILRALEVYEETGRTITAHNLETQKVPPRYDPVWLGLSFADRAALYRRIDRRVDLMLEHGLLEEIRSLLDRGVPRTATALQAIGYKEFLPVLEGKRTPEEAAEEVKRGSRRYAKRQLTWFRRNEKIHWILQRDPPDPEAVAAEALRQISFFDGET